MKQLRLGILGMSPGNGHPYSWSAICNGYDPEQMQQCPFPVIPEYLAKEQFPQAQLHDVRVTHIWTQEVQISQQVAAATHIPTIVSHPEEMIGQVDAILLARDDAENHLAMSKPFLQAGLPIYIDKPLAFDIEAAEKIFKLEQYPGQIFTATALAFAPELQLTPEIKTRIGELRYIHAVTIKDWQKYGVHIIEPVLRMIDYHKSPSAIQALTNNVATIVSAEWDDGLHTSWAALGDAKTPISITLFGTKGKELLQFFDTYRAFKSCLAEFVACVRGTATPPEKELVYRVVELIEKGDTNEKS